MTMSPLQSVLLGVRIGYKSHNSVPAQPLGGQTPPLPGLGLLSVKWGEELPPPAVMQAP